MVAPSFQKKGRRAAGLPCTQAQRLFAVGEHRSEVLQHSQEMPSQCGVSTVAQNMTRVLDGSAGTRTRNQPRKLSGLLYSMGDCRTEIASCEFFFRFKICSSLRASAIDGSCFATTISTSVPNR